MIQVDDFIRRFNLRPGDAVVINKTFFGTSDPYAIYLGRSGTAYDFWVREGKRTAYLDQEEVFELFAYRMPRRINRFVGNEDMRRRIVHFARTNEDRKAYSLLLNNCEDYAAYGKASSGKAGSDLGTVIGVAALVALAALLLGGGDD